MKPSKSSPDKLLILCADDYGQNAAIDEGILLLATNERINAISCMVNSANWPHSAHQLEQVKQNCLIGLHINLTFGQALSLKWQQTYTSQFNSLSSLMRKVYLNDCAPHCIEAEILAQLAAFQQTTGKNPDFIDGHEHVHQLPLIRDILLRIYKQEKLIAFCRNTSNGWQDFFSLKSFPKQQAILLLGGFVWRQRLKQRQIAANTSFAGIYNFAKAKNYRYYFQHFLQKSSHGGLIMCHPGKYSNDATDPLSPFRHLELNYFMSDAYLADLTQEKCQLIKHAGVTT